VVYTGGQATPRSLAKLGKAVSSSDYYKLLGIDRAESPQGIHAAYRRLAKQCHPDVGGGDSKERFQGIQQAYEVLSDPNKRKNYDASIGRGRREGTSGVAPEPLVTPPYRSGRTYPEPLIRNACPVEDLFSPPSPRAGRSGFTGSLAGIGPYAQGYEVADDEILQLLMSSLRWFRIERF
jgi:curved DNA-binding protein CbpA